MIQTTSYAIVAVLYPHEQQKYLGIVEASMGLGMLAGPAVGACLYILFAFKGTFYSVGFLFLFLAPLLYMMIPNSVNIKDGDNSENTVIRENQDSEGQITNPLQPVTYWKLFS